MTDYQKMIIQRKLFHLQILSRTNIQCIIDVFDSIKNLDLTDLGYNTAAVNALASLEIVNLSDSDMYFVEQAKQVLRRIIEFTDEGFLVNDNAKGGLVYPSWPPQ